MPRFAPNALAQTTPPEEPYEIDETFIQVLELIERLRQQGILPGGAPGGVPGGVPGGAPPVPMPIRPSPAPMGPPLMPPMPSPRSGGGVDLSSILAAAGGGGGPAAPAPAASPAMNPSSVVGATPSGPNMIDLIGMERPAAEALDSQPQGPGQLFQQDQVDGEWRNLMDYIERLRNGGQEPDTTPWSPIGSGDKGKAPSAAKLIRPLDPIDYGKPLTGGRIPLMDYLQMRMLVPRSRALAA